MSFSDYHWTVLFNFPTKHHKLVNLGRAEDVLNFIDLDGGSLSNKSAGVYLIEDFYIGKSIDIKRRVCQHINKAVSDFFFNVRYYSRTSEFGFDKKQYYFKTENQPLSSFPITKNMKPILMNRGQATPLRQKYDGWEFRGKGVCLSLKILEALSTNQKINVYRLSDDERKETNYIKSYSKITTLYNIIHNKRLK